MKKQIVIVSPALADANNGNWQTARRWQKMLAKSWKARIVSQWPDGPDAPQDVAMLALHARRSAPSIAAWAQAHGAPTGTTPGLAVVLTGTDLYRDIQTDVQAQRSLQLAQRLVLLQERAPDALPPALRAHASVIFQSTSARVTLPKGERLRAVMVGHLRHEKSPQTLFAAAHLLTPGDDILIDHIGAGLDPELAAQAQATALACPHYRWLGGLAHEATRRRIQRAHLLVHTSRMEGGAHVVMEAVCSGTPVLASRIDGNIGMLGADYAGYFEWNNAAQLVDLLRRCSAGGPLYARLQAQCAARAPLFAPEAERQALHQLLSDLTQTHP
jgi:putative glycosyltransferase (TIGR04348 family)